MISPQSSKAHIIAQSIAETLQSEISNYGSASLVVCGGSSPVEIFSNLASLIIDWHLVTIFLVDDRLVEPQSEYSNQLLLRTHLLQKNAQNATFIPLSTDFNLQKLLPEKFTLMLLRMGTDGHFASLFPEFISGTVLSSKPNSEFNISAAPAIITTPALGNPSLPRISMNLSLILNSKRLILLANGTKKQAVLAAAKEDTTLPVYYLLNQQHLTIEIESV